MKYRAGLALPFLLLCAAAAGQDAYGRLFHTPARRTELDALRARGLPLDGSPQAAPQRLDGIVLRSDGHSTVWFGGTTLRDRATSLGADSRSLALPAGGTRSVRLYVGESLLPAP